MDSIILTIVLFHVGNVESVNIKDVINPYKISKYVFHKNTNKVWFVYVKKLLQNNIQDVFIKNDMSMSNSLMKRYLSYSIIKTDQLKEVSQKVNNVKKVGNPANLCLIHILNKPIGGVRKRKELLRHDGKIRGKT